MNKMLHFLLRPKGKYKFLQNFCGGSILDIGCGKSPNRIKPLFPECHYTGLDIKSHYDNDLCMADNYVLTDVGRFSDSLLAFDKSFDYVISSHNLEHCDNRDEILELSARCVKPGGFLYLSFPSDKSTKFPRGRKGTLNYYDDSTHKDAPPSVNKCIETLSNQGFSVVYKVESYKPGILWLIGLLLEPISILLKRNSRERCNITDLSQSFG